MTIIGPEAYRLKSVDQVLRTQNNGDDLAEINRLYQELIDKVAAAQADNGKGSGSLTITVHVKANKRTMTVGIEKTAKTPKSPVFTQEYYVTEDNVLSALNPNQGDMFRTVGGDAPTSAIARNQ